MNSNPTTTWYIFHVIQIILFNFYISRKMSHISYELLRRRNPAVTNSLLSCRYLHPAYIDYIIGSMALSLLTIGFLKISPQLYWSGKYLSLFGFLFVSATVDYLRFEKLKKKIPLLPKRSASLKARSVGSIIPIWCWLTFLSVSVYGLTITNSPKQMYIQLGVVLYIVGVAYKTEKKAKLALDKDEEDIYRSNEAWTIYVIGMFLAIGPILSKYFGHYGIDAIYSSIAIIAFVIFSNSKIYQRIINEPLSQI